MRTMRKIVASVLLAATIFSLSVGTAFAAEDSIKTIQRSEAYTNTITLYAGGRGEFRNPSITGIEGADISYETDKIVISNLKGNEIFSVSASMAVAKEGEATTINGVTVAGEKYYVKGFNESGRDNTQSAQTLTINVAEVGNADYVVAYGIPGNQVSYTVSYVDRSGKELLPTETFFGNVGDKPIVMYRYIPGYAPEVEAYTKTLEELSAEELAEGKTNGFTFVYDKVPTRKVKEVVIEKETTETVYNYVTEGTTIYVDGGSASNVTGGGAGTGAGGAGEAGEDADNQAGAGDETGIPGLEESEIVDLDDEETPLANIEVEGDEEAAGSSTGVYIGLGLLAIIIAAIVAYIVSKKRKVQE